MPETKIENALITGTMLGEEGHDILTAYIFLEGGGWGCGFGGYALDQFVKAAERRLPTAAGLFFITEVMRTVGVEKWEDLKGKYCRAETEGLGGKITKIGHITKDVWFDPAQMFAEWKDRKL